MNTANTPPAVARLLELAAHPLPAVRTAATMALEDIRCSWWPRTTAGARLARRYVHQVEAVEVFAAAGLSVAFTDWPRCSRPEFGVSLGRRPGLQVPRWFGWSSAARARRSLGAHLRAA